MGTDTTLRKTSIVRETLVRETSTNAVDLSKKGDTAELLEKSAEISCIEEGFKQEPILPENYFEGKLFEDDLFAGDFQPPPEELTQKTISISSDVFNPIDIPWMSDELAQKITDLTMSIINNNIN